MKVVSACLAGIKCSWDGKDLSCQKVIDMVKLGDAIPICPELLGGLQTPRDPSEQKGRRVFTKNEVDVTAQFERGATETLRVARQVNCAEAILKSNSASCGSGKIYDGTFSGKLIDGDGVTAKLLKENGIKVISEKDL
jgi:uncharacterized protein YbbK (DUF523 family)